MKRDIFITICHAWATPEDAMRFRNSATMMARAGHPNVQAVYQAGVYAGRDFFCREKWDVPNLSEMATAGQRIDPRLAAQIIHIVGAVVIFWDANNFPHTTIGATDVTVSSQGVIKLANCVDPTQAATPPGMSDLSALAHAVAALLPPAEEVPASVTNLLQRLQAGPVPLAQTVSEAQAIDNNLAPEKSHRGLRGAPHRAGSHPGRAPQAEDHAVRRDGGLRDHRPRCGRDLLLAPRPALARVQ